MTLAERENKFVEDFVFEADGRIKANIALVPDFLENRIYFVPDGASAPAMISLDVLDAQAWLEEHGLVDAPRLSLNCPVTPLLELARTIACRFAAGFKTIQLLDVKAQATGPRAPCYVSKPSQKAGYGWTAYWYNKLVKPLKKARLGTIAMQIKGMDMLITKGQTVWTVIAPRHLDQPPKKKIRRTKKARAI